MELIQRFYCKTLILMISVLFFSAATSLADSAPPRNRVWFWPATWLVRFYQTQISPAIGHRCAMHPSCSTYCLQAVHAYGWRGIPMTADRLIRESDFVRFEINPVFINGQMKFDDPIEDHSYWFRRYRE